MTETDAEPRESADRSRIRYLLVGAPGKPADASDDGDAAGDDCTAEDDGAADRDRPCR